METKKEFIQRDAANAALRLMEVAAECAFAAFVMVPDVDDLEGVAFSVVGSLSKNVSEFREMLESGIDLDAAEVIYAEKRDLVRRRHIDVTVKEVLSSL